jgi:hypothetical protein
MGRDSQPQRDVPMTFGLSVDKNVVPAPAAMHLQLVQGETEVEVKDFAQVLRASSSEK